MAAPTKKRAVNKEMEILETNEDDGGSESDEGLDSRSASEEEVNEEIQVEFEARNPEDCDFHGIRKLLQQLFLKANINLSEISDTIISQNYVGSVIKQADLPEEDDEDDGMDVFGFFTVINITHRQNLDSMKQVKSFVLEKCQQCAKQHREKLATILNDDGSHVGLILSERLINIPPQIALPSYQSLWSEVERAKTKKMNYNLEYYVLISKTYHAPQSAHSGKKKKNKQPSQAGERVFVNTEDELFYKESVLSFEYSVGDEKDTAVGGAWDDEDEAMEPFRTVMVIPRDRIPAVMERMTELLAME